MTPLALALLLTLQGPAPDPGAAYPQKPGLWEDRVTMGVVTGVSQQCYGFGKPLPPAQETTTAPPGCKLDQTSGPTGLRSEMTCADGRSSGMVLEAPDAEHRAMVLSQRDATGRVVKLETASRWLSECPSDMRDGRMKTVKPLTDLRTGEPLARPKP